MATTIMREKGNIYIHIDFFFFAQTRAFSSLRLLSQCSHLESHLECLQFKKQKTDSFLFLPMHCLQNSFLLQVMTDEIGCVWGGVAIN